jgi:multimeric flavodoxin WrbA
MYGHVAKLAEEILKGANSVEGVEATLWQVQNPFLLLPSFPFCIFQFEA